MSLLISAMAYDFFLSIFIYLLAVLGLHYCEDFSSVVVSGAYSLVGVPELLIEVAFLVDGHRLKGKWTLVVGARRLESTGSAVVVQGLSCSAARVIFQDLGSIRSLYWQADSLPLSHQGSSWFFKVGFMVFNFKNNQWFHCLRFLH